MLKTLLLSATATLAFSTAALADVNVYSYRQPELVKPLFDAFTQESGIRVNVVFINKGLVERLKAEGKRSPADLIFTTDIGRLAAAVNAGVTQAVSNTTLNSQIPETLRDPSGHWFGLTSRARVVYASKDRVAEGELTTYDDLADPKFAGRICTRSGTHAYNLGLTAAVIANYGEDTAKTWLEGMKSNLARKPQGNDRAQVKAIWSGECDISVGNTYYMGLMQTNDEQKPWASSVRILFPTFKNGGTHINLSGMALTKSAPNKDEAVKLMEFLASNVGQQLYAQANHEYPVTPGVEPSDLVAAWGTFERDDTPLAEIARLRGDALSLVEAINFDE